MVAYLFAIWLTMAGVWPLAEPDHDDFLHPMTWIDYGFHFLGLIWLIVLVMADHG